jgi:DNA recombination protein RmuC
MKKLADHIRQAHEDAEEVQTSSRKISQQFQKIESAELEPPAPARPADPANVVRLPEERKPSG